MCSDTVIPIVTGPTASGKSGLALALARRIGGAIVNADAMQAYAAFPILTAQPSVEERALVPHALYGVLDLADPLTAMRWRGMAIAAIRDLLAQGRRPLLVGGSGLYLRALTRGMAPMPTVPQQVRATARAEWESLGAVAFRARLAEADPEIVRVLQPADRQRQIRAWEVFAATGTPLSAWQRQVGEGPPEGWRFVWVLLSPERAWLRGRIAGRFDAMLQAGVLDEVRAVLDRGLPDDLPGLKAHGAPELMRHLRGETDLGAARQRAIDITRQYAKRQMTWFRHQIVPDLTIDSQSSDEAGQVEQFLDKRLH
jgi:tRNA dimethylallyltransferase